MFFSFTIQSISRRSETWSVVIRKIFCILYPSNYPGRWIRPPDPFRSGRNPAWSGIIPACSGTFPAGSNRKTQGSLTQDSESENSVRKSYRFRTYPYHGNKRITTTTSEPGWSPAKPTARIASDSPVTHRKYHITQPLLLLRVGQSASNVRLLRTEKASATSSMKQHLKIFMTQKERKQRSSAPHSVSSIKDFSKCQQLKTALISAARADIRSEWEKICHPQLVEPSQVNEQLSGEVKICWNVELRY